MLARLHVQLPYYLTVPEGAQFSGYGVSLEGGYTVRFFPPGRSDRPLPPDAPQLVMDGQEAYLADVLVFEFQKDQFDRRGNIDNDPPTATIQHVLTWFLLRLRYVIDAPKLELVEFPFVPWRLVYLADDGTDLPASDDKSLVRGRGVLRFHYEHMALTPKIWDDLFALPIEFEPPQWEILLLDARKALPEVGPAIVLAATALEVFISSILDMLAKRGAVSATLWAWINDRDFFLREPSVEEQFDVLLKEFCGASLKSENDLWKAFKSIKEARNRFVHGGVPLLEGIAVDRDAASRLIGKATEIVEFVKAKLPEDLQWPKFRYQMKMKLRQQIRRQNDEAVDS